jgi:hypothetical protein
MNTAALLNHISQFLYRAPEHLSCCCELIALCMEKTQRSYLSTPPQPYHTPQQLVLASNFVTYFN